MKLHHVVILSGLLFRTVPAASYAACSPACASGDCAITGDSDGQHAERLGVALDWAQSLRKWSTQRKTCRRTPQRQVATRRRIRANRRQTSTQAVA